MKRIISTRAILFCLCFSTTFLLRGQNFSDPDPEFNQLEEYLSKGRIPPMEIENIRNKLKSGTSTNADIGNPPDWNWVRTFGGSGGVTVTDIEVDGSGNLYFLATFCDTIKFLGHTFISQGIRDVLVTKISSLGTYVWGSQLKATVEQNIYSKSLAIGTNGKVFISGNLNSTTITGGSITKTRIGEENIFNAGLDNNGIFLWLKINNKPETIEMYADAKGDIYQLTSDSLLKLSQSGNILWAKEIGGDNFDFKNEDGKIWISGKVDNPGIIIADEVFIPTIFSSGIYLIVMDTTGIYLRRKFIEYSEYYPYTSAYLELDSKGNIYLSGYIPGEIYFNGTIFSNPEGMYVFKLNSNLELVWKLNDFSGNLQFQKFNKSNNDRFYLYGFYSLSSSVDSIKIGNINVIPFNDSEDNLTGYYLAEIDSSGNVLRINTDNEMFGDFVVKSPDILYSVPVYSYDVIIEKTTLDGAQFWGFEIENTGGSASFWYTMDIDEDGNMYGQGYCYGNAKMINQNIESSGFIFVKFDNSGNLKWVRIMENPAGMSSGVRVDKSGNMYAWGTFDKYIKIQGQEYQATTASDIYLIKFDQDGDLKFVKQFDGDSYIIGTGGIDIDQAGNIIITGTFPGTLKFGIYELVSYNNSRDIFLAKIDPNGNIIWARAYGGALTDWGRSVTVDDFNNIYITGSYSDSIAFDSFIFKKISGGNDMFITKLDTQGNVIWANEGGSNNNSLRGHAIAVKGKNIFVQGYSSKINERLRSGGRLEKMVLGFCGCAGGI